MNQRNLKAVPDRPRISERTARQQKALDAILERQAEAPYGEGTVDPVAHGNYINVDEVSRRATKIVVTDSPVPLIRSILKKLGLMK